MTSAVPETDGERRARRGQVFWSLVVAVPSIIWLMRLWVEAGGQLQTMLYLVTNAGAVNLVTAVFVTAIPGITGAVVAVLAAGRMVDARDDETEPIDQGSFESWFTTVTGRWKAARAEQERVRRTPMFARWSRSAPTWLLVVTFAFALVTWKIMYLPLLAAALVVAAPPVTTGRAARVGLAAVTAAGEAALVWLLFPVARDAGEGGEVLPLLVLAVPAVLLPALILTAGLGGRLVLGRGVAVRVLARLVQPLVLVAGCWAVLPVTAMPVLPTTVTLVGPADRPTQIRGSVAGGDDRLTAILREDGGLVFVVNDDILGRILCPGEQEIPRYDLRVRDLHVEDSLLEAWGRRLRPATPVDATCRRR